MTSENAAIAAAKERPCGCPAVSVITNPERHEAWHALVIEQGGPAGRCDAAALQAARGVMGVAWLPMPYRGKAA